MVQVLELDHQPAILPDPPLPPGWSALAFDLDPDGSALFSGQEPDSASNIPQHGVSADSLLHPLTMGVNGALAVEGASYASQIEGSGPQENGPMIAWKPDATTEAARVKNAQQLLVTNNLYDLGLRPPVQVGQNTSENWNREIPLPTFTMFMAGAIQQANKRIAGHIDTLPLSKGAKDRLKKVALTVIIGVAAIPAASLAVSGFFSLVNQHGEGNTETKMPFPQSPQAGLNTTDRQPPAIIAPPIENQPAVVLPTPTPAEARAATPTPTATSPPTETPRPTATPEPTPTKNPNILGTKEPTTDATRILRNGNYVWPETTVVFRDNEINMVSGISGFFERPDYNNVRIPLTKLIEVKEAKITGDTMRIEGVVLMTNSGHFIAGTYYEGDFKTYPIKIIFEGPGNQEAIIIRGTENRAGIRLSLAEFAKLVPEFPVGVTFDLITGYPKDYKAVLKGQGAVWVKFVNVETNALAQRSLDNLFKKKTQDPIFAP